MDAGLVGFGLPNLDPKAESGQEALGPCILFFKLSMERGAAD